METIEQIQNQIIDEFSLFEDWMDKYEYIIDMGKKLEPLSEDLKKDEFLIEGCTSKAWLIPEYKDGKLHFKADGEAIISKGIITLLMRVFNKRKPEEILNSNLFFLDQIGLKQNLSPTRANGLTAMIDKIYHYAKIFQNK